MKAPEFKSSFRSHSYLTSGHFFSQQGILFVLTTLLTRLSFQTSFHWHRILSVIWIQFACWWIRGLVDPSAGSQSTGRRFELVEWTDWLLTGNHSAQFDCRLTGTGIRERTHCDRRCCRQKATIHGRRTTASTTAQECEPGAAATAFRTEEVRMKHVILSHCKYIHRSRAAPDSEENFSGTIRRGR